MFARVNAIIVVLIALLAAQMSASFDPFARPAARAQAEEPRFDSLVREDFFAGLAGDKAAFDRAMKLCEDTLRLEPQHAEALVWHGAGLLALAGQAFQRSDFTNGGQLWDRGMNEVNEAVRLQPDNVGVLIPRGATFIEISRNVPIPSEARSILATGVADYKKALGLQASYFDRLSVHARGELLFALAEGLHRLGDREESLKYFQRIVEDLKGSPYAVRVRPWITGENIPAITSGCVGCHVK